MKLCSRPPRIPITLMPPRFTHPSECLASTATEYGSSRYGEWFRCQHGHHLRYHLQLQRAPYRDAVDCEAAGDEPEGKPEGLHFEVGSLVHGGINWVTDGVVAGITRSWQDVIAAAAEFKDADHPGGFDLGSIYEAERLLGAYWLRYGEANAGWDPELEILGVEIPIDSGLALALPYTTAIDQLLRHPSGELIIVDHKTRAKSFPKDSGGRQRYCRGLATRLQFAGMSWLVRANYGLSYNPGVIVNGIIKTKIPQFDRPRVDFTDDDLVFWKESVSAAALTGLQPSAKNPTQCSPEMGGRCWAHDWCHGPQELRDRKFIVKGGEAVTKGE